MNDYAAWTALTKKKQGSGGSRPSDKRGGGGAGHPDTEIIGGRLGLKKTFSPFGPQFGLIISGEPGPPGPLPWTRHCKVPTRENELILSWFQFKMKWPSKLKLN